MRRCGNVIWPVNNDDDDVVVSRDVLVLGVPYDVHADADADIDADV
jgi:hypothetical protein